MQKDRKVKKLFAKHYTDNKRVSNVNPTKTWT